MKIRAEGITIGQPNPSPVTLSGGYRFQGRPGWPFDPASRDEPGVVEAAKGGAKARQAARLQRVAEYCRLRDEGVSRAEAEARLGVTRKTSLRYEAEWLRCSGDEDPS